MATVSKTKRILDYLAKNPDHTWSDAESRLSKYEISGNYFSMVKSKHLGKSATGKTASDGTGPRKKSTRSGGANVANLQKAAEFAKTMGGIAQAKAALSQLEEIQI